MSEEGLLALVATFCLACNSTVKGPTLQEKDLRPEPEYWVSMLEDLWPSKEVTEGEKEVVVGSEEIGGDMEEAFDLPPLIGECSEDSQCPSNYCIETPSGKECAILCEKTEDCPEGYECMEVTTFPNVTSICVYPTPNICRPCLNDADCLAPHVTTPMACVSLGGLSFCLKECLGPGDCPPGYSCALAPNSESTYLCLPDSSQCDCPPKFVQLGAKGSCEIANAYGTCKGTFTCTPFGPSACDGQVPSFEVCNGIDDDCDGLTDEEVQSPCGGCQSVCTFGVGPTTSGGEFNPTPENSSGLTKDPEGYLVLDSTTIDFPFIWIANSGEGTVSKVNTRSVCEVARYKVCLDPSRTAVDLNGNGIITCRGDGKVAKVAIFEEDCVDFNSNGQIDTSRDLNGNCRIEPNEMVTNDECVLWVVQPDGQTGTGCGSSGSGCARAAGVDRDNNIWVGFWNSSTLRKLRSSDGAVLKTIPISRRPYGLAIDQNGIIWIATRDATPHGLVKVDPNQGQVGAWNSPSGYVYGLAVDPWGKVWVASGEAQGLHRFDPETNQWTNTWTWSGRGSTRGVAVSIIRDASGMLIGSKVYVAHHTWTCQNGRYISVVDAKTLADESPIDLGGLLGPVGVALDFDGFLWSINQCTSSASKIDTNTKQVVATQPVGASPYTYSDMTGYALKTITAPEGYYRHTFEGFGRQPTAWNLLFVDADLPGEGKTFVTVRFRVADDLQDLQGQEWQGPFGPFPPEEFPLDLNAAGNNVGLYFEVEVTLHTTDSTLIPRLKGISVVASVK